MFGKKDKERVKWSLLVIYGLANTFEQWSKILLPFSQWQLKPRPSLFDSLILNCIGNTFMVFGTFFIAQMIDTMGGKAAAIVSTTIIGIYQAVIGNIHNYYIFGTLEILLFFNHMPTIVEALIGQLIGEDGDDKERSRLLMRLIIPSSIAFAAGPYLAVQVLDLITPSLVVSQTLCGILNILTILPLVLFVLPNPSQQSKRFQGSTVRAYFELLRESNFLWTLLFIVVGIPLINPNHT